MVTVEQNAAPRNIHEQYESLLASGFAQTAYMARDIFIHGQVSSETHCRVDNELAGLAIEKLGKPYHTSYEYNKSSRGLMAEDGELLIDIFTRGEESAQSDAVKNPSLKFRAIRHTADVDHAKHLESLVLDPLKPVGTTVVIASPCPDANELGVSHELLANHYYQPGLDMAMIWIATKTDSGIRLQTINLFHAEPVLIQQSLARVLGRSISVSSRERMVHERHEYLPVQETDVSQELRVVFDTLASSLAGKQTYHGLLPHEHSQKGGSQELVFGDQFEASRSAARSRLEEVALSLVEGRSYVPESYLQTILALRRPDGSYELEGARREAMQAVIEGRSVNEEFVLAMQSVHQATCAGLWATLRTIYDGGEVAVASSSIVSSLEGLGQLQYHRSVGSQENGCPGGGAASSHKESIFDMSQDKLASIFLVQKFITNCPLCNESGVEATRANGTITCGTCGDSVDVCTGEVTRSRKNIQNKRKKASRWFSSNQVSIYDILGLTSTSKKQTRKMQKREKIKA